MKTKVDAARHEEAAGHLIVGLKQAHAMLEALPPPSLKEQGPAISGLRPMVREDNDATPVTLPATPMAVLGRMRPR